MKFSYIVIFFIFTGCATARMYENSNGIENTHVYYIAEGPQPIEVFGQRYFIKNKEDRYELKDYNHFIAQPNSIIIWVNGEKRAPQRYQIMNGDEFILSGEIIYDPITGDPDREIILNGKVASTQAIRLKPMPLELKVALTPFTLAADISVFPFLIISDPKAAPEIIKLGILAAATM